MTVIKLKIKLTIRLTIRLKIRLKTFYNQPATTALRVA